MTSDTIVSYADLLEAFEWVSSSASFEHSAIVSLETGVMHWVSDLMELDNDLPEDIEDSSLYIAVPHKTDLDLGKSLALRFAHEVLPESSAEVASFFRQRGAYARFKDLLENKGQLEAWYAYESQAVAHALREWCKANSLKLKPY